MQKKLWLTGIMFILVTVFSSLCWSMDYINMSNEALFELRGAMQNALEPDKTAYQVEWEKRVAAMTDEEKNQFVERSKVGEDSNNLYKQPFFIMGQGYETKKGEGGVIIGAFPENSGSTE